MREDIRLHVQAARKYGEEVGWLWILPADIYLTYRDDHIQNKSGEWALEQSLCPDKDMLQKALQIRKKPLRYSKEDRSIDNRVIQRFADVLEGYF